MKRGRRLSPEDVKRVLGLGAQGFSWKRIAACVGCTVEAARSILDPTFRERRNAQIRDARQRRSFGSRSYSVKPHPPTPHFRPPPETLLERDRRFTRPFSIAIDVLGEPEPGRSALDQRGA